MKHSGDIASQAAGLRPALRESHSRQTARIALYARMLLSDALAIFIGFSLAKAVRGGEWLAPNGISLIGVLIPLFIVIAGNNRAYSLEVLGDFGESARRTINAAFVTFLVLFAVVFATKSNEDVSRLGVLITFAGFLFTALLFRYFTSRWVRRTLGGVLFDELLIIDGVPPAQVATAHMIDARENNLVPDLNDPAMLERFAKVTDFYDRVVISCPIEREFVWATMLKGAGINGEILVERRKDIGILGSARFGGADTLVVSHSSLSLSDRVKKRAFDLVIALSALIFLAPLLIVVALLIKLDSPGPVFFRQPRVGRKNVTFNIFKFRSMCEEKSDVRGVQSTQRDDQRISRFGRFIRRTSIDELPQLLNVVRGEMSIVGPRPHALGSMAEDRLFWEISQHYWERHALQPGITGLAQVRGYRGATEKTSDLTDRLQADLEYLQDWRLWRDVVIVAATLKVLIHPNAY